MSAQPPDAGPDPTTEGRAASDDRTLRRMRRALAEVRREGWKVAVIYATFDAALVALLANLLLSLSRPSVLPATLPLPSVALRAVRGVGVVIVDPAVATSTVVGVGLGLLVFGTEVAVRVRRPVVERFEGANPPLAEALRTARDAVEDGSETRIARRLYDDVLAELGRSSSIGLLDLRRLAATAVVITLISLASIQVAVIDLSFGGVGPGPTGPVDGGVPSDYGGLQDPGAILGEPEDVPSGREDLDAILDASGQSGDAGPATDAPAAYEDSGFADAGTVEGQRAGFAEGEQLEDAALIREYNLQIREGADG